MFAAFRHSCPALLDGDERCRQFRAAEDAPIGFERGRFPGLQHLGGLTVERHVARLSSLGPVTADACETRAGQWIGRSDRHSTRSIRGLLHERTLAA